MSGTAAGKSMAEIEQFLYSAVISDILDEIGFRSQACDPAIRPLDRSRKLELSIGCRPIKSLSSIRDRTMRHFGGSFFQPLAGRVERGER